jgi:hypothetical protein
MFRTLLVHHQGIYLLLYKIHHQRVHLFLYKRVYCKCNKSCVHLLVNIAEIIEAVIAVLMVTSSGGDNCGCNGVGSGGGENDGDGGRGGESDGCDSSGSGLTVVVTLI